jgi:DNA repair protein RecO (recombination protein O)
MTAARPRFYSTEAVVVRQTDVGEADRLLVLLTPDRGLLRVTARGARKPGSKIGGHLDLLCRSNVSISSGRGLETVSQAETIEAFRGLRTDLGRLSRGLYLAELGERFAVEEAPSHAPFRLLVDSLRTLETLPPESADLLVRWHELRLLALHGFVPEVQRCADCASPLEPEDHVFSAARGGIVCPGCRGRGDDPLLPASVAVIKVLRFLRRSSWAEASSLRLGEDDRRQIERIMRAHLHYVLDRDVKSSAFLDEVRKKLGVAEKRAGLERQQ